MTPACRRVRRTVIFTLSAAAWAVAVPGLISQLVGDGLVRLDSAPPPGDVADDITEIAQANHLQLLNHPQVFAAIASKLGLAPASAPRCHTRFSVIRNAACIIQPVCRAVAWLLRISKKWTLVVVRCTQ
jgi:hypothetical protein